MADTAPKRKLTWKEKLDQGKKLNALEDTQADADFNYRRRLREEKEKKAYEASKNRQAPSEATGTTQEGDK
jgi:hypothetical protein